MSVLTGIQFNEQYPDIEFYKIINAELTHHNFKFIDGLNIDTIPFNPTNECSPGGIYFSEKSKIYKYFYYGIYIIKVSIPDDAQVYIEKDKFKADKIILDLNNKTLYANWNEWLNYDFCLNSVKFNGYTLQYVISPTPELCMAAVQQCGYALYYVKNQTPEICMAAVQHCGHALKFVILQTPEICMAAVQQDGCVLQFVINQTPEICMAAVQENGYALEYVKEQTPEICMTALQQNNIAQIYMKIKI